MNAVILPGCSSTSSRNTVPMEPVKFYRYTGGTMYTGRSIGARSKRKAEREAIIPNEHRS